MNEDNALRMAAEVTDRFTVPLKNLQAQLRKIKSPPNINELQKEFTKLGQTVNSTADAVKGTFIPVLGALGITTFTLGAAIAKVVSSMIELSKETVELTFLSKETGISVNDLRDMQSASKSVGVDNSTFQNNVRNFSVVMEQIRAGKGDTLKWLRESPNMKVRSLALQLRATSDNFEAYRLVMDLLPEISEPAQWGYWVTHFGLDVRMGRNAMRDWSSELEKARTKHGALTGEDLKAATNYKDAMGKLKGSFDKFIATIGREALPVITKVVEAVIKWMDNNGDRVAEDIKDAADGLRELTASMTEFKAAMGTIIAIALGSWIGGLAGAAIGLFAAYKFMKGFEMPEWMETIAKLVGGETETAKPSNSKDSGSSTSPVQPPPKKSSKLQEDEEKENLEEGSKQAFLNGLREFYGPDAGVSGGSIDISSSNRYGGGRSAGTGGGRGSYTGGKGFGNFEPSVGPTGLINPITGTVGRGVGETPSASASGVHEGQDISAAVGTPVHAVAAGTIVSVKTNRGISGKTVTIRHDDGSHSRYLHLDDHRRAARMMAAGQRIKQGDVFGTSGFPSSPHLHYEVWPGKPGVGKPYNLWELHNWRRGQNIGGGLPERPDGGKVLDFGKRSGLIGPTGGKDATLRVKIDLNGFPRGTQFASSMGGIVDSVSVSRNRPPMNERGAA